MNKRKLIQLTLISSGILLVIFTYFLYPSINKNKMVTKNEKIEEKKIELKKKETTEEKTNNTFKNVEYGGLYNYNKPFTVRSEKAYIKPENDEIVYMTNMHVTLELADRIVVITSNEGSYNKKTYDCFFVDNVKATDGDTIILAENLDLLATEDSAAVYNNVYLTNENGSLRADKVDYDFETKYYNISMFGDKKVKVKLIQ